MTRITRLRLPHGRKILTIPGLDADTASQSAGSIAETKRLMAGGK